MTVRKVVRRVGAESSATRALIIEATEAVMREEGHAATSTRRVAARAGLKPSLVHYYFPTTEDLLLAMFRKGAAESDAALDKALAAPDPLMALWGYLTDNSRNALAIEIIAMASRRPAVRAEIAAHMERARARQVACFERLLGERLVSGQGPGGCPPAGLSLVLAGVARALITEGGLGISGGHAEAQRWVEEWLTNFAPDQGKPAR